MNYWVLHESGIPVSKTTVKRITEVERGFEVNKDILKSFYAEVSEKFKNRKISVDGSINPKEWKELVDNDKALLLESLNFFHNPDVSDADDFSPDSFDGCFNMDIAMKRGGGEPQLAKVVNQMKDNEGNPIIMANKNLILDTIAYEIEFQDGLRQPLADNLIAENLFAQVNQ